MKKYLLLSVIFLSAIFFTSCCFGTPEQTTANLTEKISETTKSIETTKTSETIKTSETATTTEITETALNLEFYNYGSGYPPSIGIVRMLNTPLVEFKGIEIKQDKLKDYSYEIKVTGQVVDKPEIKHLNLPDGKLPIKIYAGIFNEYDATRWEQGFGDEEGQIYLKVGEALEFELANSKTSWPIENSNRLLILAYIDNPIVEDNSAPHGVDMWAFGKYELVFSNLEKVEDVQFGLTGEQRKQAYYELVALQDDVSYEDSDYDKKIDKTYIIIAKKYGITLEEIKYIGYEGDAKNWPMPPLE